VRVLRLTVLSSIALAATAAGLIGSARATHGENKFAGQWKTNIGEVTFDVVSSDVGKARLTAVNGNACAGSTVYYLADYSDQSNTSGKMAACTLSPTHLVGRYRSDRSTAYPGGGFDITFTPPNTFTGFYTADDPQFPGQFPYSGTFVAHTSNDGCCLSSTGGGTGPTTAPTANVPFGTPVTIGYRLGGVVAVPSPALPVATTEVDLDAQVSDAEIDRFVAVLKMALAAYNRRKAIDALVSYCIVFIPKDSSTKIGLNDFEDNVDNCEKFGKKMLSKKKSTTRRLAVATGACTAYVVPVWKRGTRATLQQYQAAVAAARTQASASCTSPTTGRVSLKVRSTVNTTLNQVLGTSAHADVAATGTGSNAQLRLTWARPRTRGTPPPPGTGKARAGHYSGQTSDAKPVSFDVTAGGASAENLRAAAQVTCTNGSKWSWTMISSASNPIKTGLRFSHSYNGPLTLSGSTITNINATYTLAGTLTAAGTASGTFFIRHMTWDDSGKHYDCTGSQVTWTAHFG
jgi:hypothetical protein